MRSRYATAVSDDGIAHRRGLLGNFQHVASRQGYDRRGGACGPLDDFDEIGIDDYRMTVRARKGDHVAYFQAGRERASSAQRIRDGTADCTRFNARNSLVPAGKRFANSL